MNKKNQRKVFFQKKKLYSNLFVNIKFNKKQWYWQKLEKVTVDNSQSKINLLVI